MKGEEWNNKRGVKTMKEEEEEEKSKSENRGRVSVSMTNEFGDEIGKRTRKLEQSDEISAYVSAAGAALSASREE